ncbi:MAG: ubiquitin-like domain-containing protein, partial [Chloroflexota bacterium]
MRRAFAYILLASFLVAFQSAPSPRVTLLVDGQRREVAAGDLIPAHMLEGAGISFSPSDRVLVDGVSVPLDQTIQAEGNLVMQLRRAMPVTVIVGTQQFTFSSAAFTVREALREAQVSLGIHDRVEPPLETVLAGPTIVTLTQARQLSIQTASGTVHAYASAATVGAALAQAGIPLMGLDQASPSENEAYPADGQIRVARITESVQTAYRGIPFETELIVTTELAPPLQDVLQPGAYGLSFTRTRIRYVDGVETGRVVESETVVRAPQKRIARSSYWAAKQMYATSYSPCNSGTDTCISATSSGLTVQRGVVAMMYDWYIALGGTRVFIPGYG